MQNNPDNNSNPDDSKEIIQKEKVIDPGNEHHHPENIQRHLTIKAREMQAKSRAKEKMTS